MMELKDWKGNLIKIGDTVVTVEVNNPFGGAAVLWGFQTADGEIGILDSTPIEKEHTWIPTGEYKIIEGHTVTANNDGFHHEVPIQLMDFWIPTSNLMASIIWCIKGVSDDQEEYYLHYFK